MRTTFAVGHVNSERTKIVIAGRRREVSQAASAKPGYKREQPPRLRNQRLRNQRPWHGARVRGEAAETVH